MLNKEFFNQDACELARSLLGKIIRHKFQRHWLSARIIETEAYYYHESGSHSSLGYTEKRRAMFMPPGTIYMYYSRGGDSLNISSAGEGNAVLIKSAFPYSDEMSPKSNVRIMQRLNPARNGQHRVIDKLCCGQTLLCKSLNIKVGHWDQLQFDPSCFYIDDVGVAVKRMVQTRRLGIPSHRDDHLMYRYIDYEYVRHCSKNPVTSRTYVENQDYKIIQLT